MPSLHFDFIWRRLLTLSSSSWSRSYPVFGNGLWDPLPRTPLFLPPCFRLSFMYSFLFSWTLFQFDPFYSWAARYPFCKRFLFAVIDVDSRGERLNFAGPETVFVSWDLQSNEIKKEKRVSFIYIYIYSIRKGSFCGKVFFSLDGTVHDATLGPARSITEEVVPPISFFFFLFVSSLRCFLYWWVADGWTAAGPACFCYRLICDSRLVPPCLMSSSALASVGLQDITCWTSSP